MKEIPLAGIGTRRAESGRPGLASPPCRLAIPAALLALALAGCALTKPPTHPEVVDDALPKNSTIPSKWVAGGNAKDVSDDWLKSFRDPGLNAIVAEALANNPDLRQAAAAVQVAKQTVVVVGAQMLPQVGVDLGASTLRDAGRDNWFDSRKGLAGVAWEPDVWGRVRAKRSAATAQYEATTLDYAYARISLAATTAKAWYRTTETLQLQDLAGKTVEIHEKLLGLVKTRREAGKVDDLDLAEATANLNAARSALAHAQGLAAESRRALETLVGRYPAAELQAGRDFVPVPPPVRAGLPSSLLDRRPDLVAAEREVIAAFRNRESARLALLPTFSLNLNAGKLSDGLLDLLQLNPWMLHATLGMTIPIYTGGALTAEIKIANARQEEAIAGYGGAALVAFREVENALMNENVLARRLRYDQQAMADLTDAVRIANIQFKAGKITLLSVLQLQEAQLASEAAVIKLRSAQLANRIELHLALGGSFDGPQASD